MKKNKKVKLVYSNADDLLWLSRIKKNYKNLTKEERLRALVYNDCGKHDDCK